MSESFFPDSKINSKITSGLFFTQKSQTLLKVQKSLVETIHVE